MDIDSPEHVIIDRFQPLSTASKQTYNFVAASVIGALLLVISLRIFLSNRQRLRLPPGPPGWPVVGHLLHLGKLPHHTMMKWAQQYGPIVSLKLGYRLAVVVSSSEIAREVLKTQDTNFASRPKMAVGEILGFDYQDMGWAPYGQQWRFLRKICLTELLGASRLAEFKPIRNEEIRNCVRTLLEDGSGDKAVALKGRLPEMTTNVITRMMFGKAYFGANRCNISDLTGNDDFHGLIRDVFQVAQTNALGDYIPLLRNMDVGGAKALMWNIRRKFEAFFTAIIEERRLRKKNYPNSEVENFVDVMLGIKDENTGNSLTDFQIIPPLIDMFLGAADTSAGQSMWTLIELMRHPEIRKKVQLELDEVVGRDRLLEESDLPQLKYLDAVIKESFRLRPVAPLLMPHVASADTKVAGYDIPAETILLVNVMAVQRDSQVWKNPLEFNPERFLDSSIDVKGQNFELLPFGSGRRICPGINLGVLMVNLPLAQLLHTCDFSLPPGTKPEDITVEATFGLAARPAYPLEVLVKPRLPQWNELQALAAM